MLPNLRQPLMKFLADVNFPQSAIRFLRDLGYDVLDSKKDYLRAPDIELNRLAKDEERVILTRDSDYKDLVKLPKYQVPLILFRLADQKPVHIIEHLKELLENQTAEELSSSSITLTEEDIQIDSYPTKR